MTGKLICPECGGIIGECTTDTEVPCHCKQAHIEDFDAPAETVESDREGSGGAKVCRHCGADVSGKKRYKDSLGYWCVNCHKAEKKQQKAGQKQCTDCHRWFPVEKLIDSDQERLCYTCNRNRNAQRREILRKASKGRIHRLHEQKQFITLVGIFLILLLILAMLRMGWIGGG